MTPRKQPPNLSLLGREALAEVLEKMLRWRVAFASLGENLPPLDLDRIVAKVALVGSRISGGVWLHLPRTAVRRAAQHLTGLEAAAVPHGLLEDTAGELANMVAGCVARRLAQTGWPCQLGAPRILRTRRVGAKASRSAKQVRIRAACADQQVELQIEIRQRNS